MSNFPKTDYFSNPCLCGFNTTITFIVSSKRFDGTLFIPDEGARKWLTDNMNHEF